MINHKRTLRKTLLNLALVLAATSSVVGCDVGGDENDLTAAYSENTPRDFVGIQTGREQIRWQWQAYSPGSKYDMFLDGEFKGQTANTNFISDNVWVGEHSFQMQIITPDGRYLPKSETVKIITRGDWAPGMDVRSFFPNGDPHGSSGGQSSTPTPSQAQPDTGIIDPASWNKPGIGRDGYQLAFSDEFDQQNEVNPNRWNTQLRWDGDFNGERYEYRVINGEEQFYVNVHSPDDEHRNRVPGLHNPFQFDGSNLNIRAIKNPAKTRDSNNSYGRMEDILQQQPFLSGAISTYDKFVAKYGYFEARIKIPQHVGAFPAFWLHHQKRQGEGTHRNEIDIMENLGHDTRYVYNTFHTYDGVSNYNGGTPIMLKPTQPGQSYPNGQIHNGTNFGDDFHVYAVQWDPGVVRWLIDGQVVNELYSDRVNYEELYIIVNLAMGGNWTELPSNAGGLGRQFPDWNDLNSFGNPALQIDYVRAYRRN